MTEPTSSLPSASAAGASRMLDEVTQVRRRTRTHVQSFWFPLTVFGALSLLSAPFTLIADGTGSAIFWSVGGPIGGAMTAFYYRHLERRLGVGSPALPYGLTGLAMMAGAFLLPMVVTGPAQASISVYAIAAGYAVFALLERSKMLVVVAVVMAAIPTVVIAADIASPGLVTALLTGALMLATGMIRRTVELAAHGTATRTTGAQTTGAQTTGAQTTAGQDSAGR